ncbi:MAG: dipeptide ABC transporter ATP-binding protein [Gammaproteobacteria bacterium]|nr:dipeptide ABC transporter ATP-binding protein [Gammaproteobacteria bacterium]
MPKKIPSSRPTDRPKNEQEPLLRVENLTTIFETSRSTMAAVKNVSFNVKAGETFALVGESGSGKSITALSVIRLLPDAAKVTAGTVKFDGTDLLMLPERDLRDIRGSGISMIFQEPMTSLNPVVKVGKQISEVLMRHQSMSKAQARQRALDLLDAVKIPKPGYAIDTYAHELSGGMKQRVMIAIALACEPKLLIADEPTTALDVTIQAQVLDLINDLQQQFKMAIIFITHDLGVVKQVADHVAVMKEGEIVEQSSNEVFFTSPQHPYSWELFAALPTMEKRGQPLLASHGKQKTQPVSYVAEPNDTLRVNDLKVHFPIRKGFLKRVVGHVKAVDGVSLEIPKGKTIALVGESGSGKTTVGKGILRLVQPTAGEVTYLGLPIHNLDRKQLLGQRANLQIIFQDPYSSMNPRMLVGEIIEEGMKALKVIDDAKARKVRVLELLEQVGLDKDTHLRYPHEFSGGQRQRICIARALAVNPKIIICDEPTSALDVSVQAQILDLLNDLQNQYGISYLFITHNMSVVAYFADRVAVMYQGKIVEQGDVEQVLTNPTHEYTKALLSAVPKLVPPVQAA